MFFGTWMIQVWIRWDWDCPIIALFWVIGEVLVGYLMNNWELHRDLPGITVGGVGNRFLDFEGLGFWGSEIGPKSSKIGPNGPSRTVIGFLGGTYHLKVP